MKILTARLMVIMILALITQPNAWAEQVDREKEAAINQYLKVAPVDGMINDAMIEFLKAVPEESRKTIEDTFKIVNKKKISDAMVVSMRKLFTTKEIVALAKFYSSQEGKSVMRKMITMQSEILPVFQAEITAAMMKVYKIQNKPKDSL